MRIKSQSPLQHITFALVSLGCAKNLVDSERALARLVAAGATWVDDPAEADVVIINTCGFIRPAQAESVEALTEALELQAEGSIKGVVCCGCLSQRFADELQVELPELKVLLGVEADEDLVPAVQAAVEGRPFVKVSPPGERPVASGPRLLTTPPWYAYLKVAEGCSNWCSYCAIPLIRGPARSLPLDTVVDEARRLVSEGVRELNVIAQDLGRYGTDLTPRTDLVELIDALCDNCGEGLHWLRLLYVHPAHLPEGLPEVIRRQAKVVPYLDLPFQHASASVLKRMNRTGSSAEYLGLIQRLREQVPGIALRTTVMVGFPGETEQDFEELLAFLEAARFERATAFVYSPEEGTAAYELPDRVPEEVAQARFEAVFELQRELSAEFNRTLIGQKLEVLVEEQADGAWLGRTYRDAPEVDCQVKVQGEHLAPGTFVQVRITTAEDYDLEGVVDE